jgi:hypothetical protein
MFEILKIRILDLFRVSDVVATRLKSDLEFRASDLIIQRLNIERTANE